MLRIACFYPRLKLKVMYYSCCKSGYAAIARTRLTAGRANRLKGKYFVRRSSGALRLCSRFSTVRAPFQRAKYEGFSALLRSFRHRQYKRGCRLLRHCTRCRVRLLRCPAPDGSVSRGVHSRSGKSGLCR